MIAHLDTFARTILLALGSGILAGALLAIVVVTLARTMKPSATTRHVLWWIVLAVAAILPFASLAMSLQRVEHRAAAAIITETAGMRGDVRSLRNTGSRRRDDNGLSSMRSPVPVRDAARSPAATPDARDTNAQMSDWLATGTRFGSELSRVPGLPAAFVALWLAVAAVRLGLLVPGLVWLLAVKRAALPLDEGVVRRLRRYRYGSRTGRATTIALSADIDVPIAVGFGTPAILLPIRVAETETIADLDHIVMHEHAHLNRYDDVTNFVQCVLERIFWFNPVVALAGRRISLEREIACDDSVVAQTGRAHRYATCLWKLVESATLPARPVMAPGALLTPKQITRRIEQLLDSKRNALPRLSPASAIALSSLGAALIFFQAQRAPVIALEDPPAPAAPAAPVVRTPTAPAPPAEPRISAPNPRVLAPTNAARVASLAPLASVHHLSSLKTLEAATLATSAGLDIAKEISESVAPRSDWPNIESSIDRAKNRAARQLAMGDATNDSSSNGNDRHNLGSFHRIELDGSYDVVVRYASTASVDFQGDAGTAAHTRLRVEDETLAISQTTGSYREGRHKPIIVYVPSVDAVEVDGSSNVEVEAANGEHFSAKISGSGNLRASGSVRTLDVEIAGSGNADLLHLAATTIRVSSEGSGDVKIAAPDTLTVRLDGSGDVAMRGTAKHVTSHVDGSGKLVLI